MGGGAPTYAPAAEPPTQRRTYSQPASDQQANGRLDHVGLVQRPNTEAGDGSLPEWMRDLAHQGAAAGGSYAHYDANGMQVNHFAYDGGGQQPGHGHVCICLVFAQSQRRGSVDGRLARARVHRVAVGLNNLDGNLPLYTLRAMTHM